MSEFHAAMGLCNLNHIGEILRQRKAICEAYDQALFKANVSGLDVLVHRDEASRNHAYYPVVFESEGKLLNAVARLESNGIYARRYFYPALDQVSVLSCQNTECLIASDVSKAILCLPLSGSMDLDLVDKIGDIIG